MRVLVSLMLGGLCALSGCDKSATSEAQSRAATSATPRAASASASATPPAPPAPWYVGEWKGTYEARHYLIEMSKKEGRIAAWEQDEGGEGSGEGTVAVSIDDGGAVSGKLSGPLGEMVASGAVEDDDTVRIRVTPKGQATEKAFRGFILAKKDDDAIVGTLQAASGDSLTVRDAPVKLAKSK